MTPGRLYLFSLLALVLAGILLFSVPDSGLINTLGAVALGLGLVGYLLGLYLARIGRRGEEALTDLQQRIATVTGREIRKEYRTFIRSGLEGVPSGELLIFYRSTQGWLLVPLLEDLSWIEVPDLGVGEVKIEEGNAEEGVRLLVEMETAAGKALNLKLGSTLRDPSVQTTENVRDLNALKKALCGSD